MHLIPQVQKREEFSDAFEFKSFFADTPEIPVDYIKTFSEFKKDGVRIEFKKDERLQDEEYFLELSDIIAITAKGAEGAFRACTTLKQLAADENLKKQKIHDFPDIKNRGVMIDISRGKIPKLEVLLKMAEILRDLKYNQIQLYIDGPFFEFAHFEKYCKDVLTVEDLKIFKDFCDKHFIKLVPNQNAFGHMEKWLKKPELAHLGIECGEDKQMDTLNPLDKASLDFIDTLFADSLPYFDEPLINIGMDETWSLGMGQTKEICEKEGKGKVYVDYLNKVIKLANEKYHKTPMFWDDIALNHSELLDGVDKNCIVMDWNYESEAPFNERARLLNELGLKFYACPGTSTWGSFTGRFDNMINNQESAAKAVIEFGGEGYLLTDWGDGGNPQFFPMSIMPYIFGACCAWNYEKKPEKLHSYVSYDKEVMILKRCEEYADKFIFGQKGVGRILHKMANYYLLENQNRFNGTYVWADSEAWCKDEIPDNEWLKPCLDIPTIRSIIRYMSDIKAEIAALPENTPYIDEISCNCDEVILFARFIESSLQKTGKTFKNDALKSDLETFKKEFVRLWNTKNHKTGSEIFIARIDGMLKCME